VREGEKMKKLSKNFRQNATVEAMANVCKDGCYYCSCASGTYCQCTTVSDYAGYQYYPAQSTAYGTLYTNRFNILVQYEGMI